MLSATAVEIVRSSLPVVDASISQVASDFYQRMFAARPDLERDLFNRGNQAQGDQQRALAGAITTYASMLVDGAGSSGPDGLLARVANKHASLGITRDQYPIVHKYLFEALAQVLGDTATPEVVAAWDEVYWDLADRLIGLEDELYARFGVAPGDVWRELVVRERHQQSPATVAFGLAHPDGLPLPKALPGQYISVQVGLPDGAHQIRQYSLTGARDSSMWTITVKAVPATTHDGVSVPAGEVSNFLHHNVFEGDTLACSLPYGDLVLDERDDPLVLASAGIGCTPIIGMLHYLARGETGREVTVLHADQSPAQHAHRRELSELVDRIPHARLFHWYEDLGSRPVGARMRRGLIELDDVPITPDAQAYLCGPMPFMGSVRSLLTKKGLPPAHIHYEVFGPDTLAAAAPAAG